MPSILSSPLNYYSLFFLVFYKKAEKLIFLVPLLLSSHFYLPASQLLETVSYQISFTQAKIHSIELYLNRIKIRTIIITIRLYSVKNATFLASPYFFTWNSNFSIIVFLTKSVFLSNDISQQTTYVFSHLKIPLVSML